MSSRIPDLAPRTTLSAALAAIFISSAPAAAQGPRVTSVLEDRQVAAAIDLEIARHRAHRLYKRNDYAAAIPALRAIAQRTPKDGRVWHQIGICEIRSGQLGAAAGSFQKQFDHGFARGNARFNLACTAAQAGRVDGALEHLRQAIAIGYLNENCIECNKHLEPVRKDPRYRKLVERADALRRDLHRADEAWDDEKFADAAARYQALLAQDLRTGRILHRLGVAQLKTKELAAAARSFAAQIDVGHDVGMAHYNIACSYALRGDTTAALRSLEQAIDQGFHPHPLLRSDDDLASLRGTPRFTTLRKRALELCRQPKLASLAANLADWEGATEAAEAMLAEDEKSETGLCTLADAQMELGEDAKATATTRRQITHSYQVRGGLLRLAKIYQRVGQHTDAAECLERAIRAGCRDCCDVNELTANPRGEYDSVRLRLADALVLDAFDAVDWSDLEGMANKKLKRRPKHGPALHMLASALLRLGRQTEARAALQQQIESGHWAELARLNMARSFEIDGNREEAIRWLESAVEAGLRNPVYVTRAPRLDKLRRDERYPPLEERMKQAGKRTDKKTGKTGRASKRK